MELVKVENPEFFIRGAFFVFVINYTFSFLLDMLFLPFMDKSLMFLIRVSCVSSKLAVTPT